MAAVKNIEKLTKKIKNIAISILAIYLKYITLNMYFKYIHFKIYTLNIFKVLKKNKKNGHIILLISLNRINRLTVYKIATKMDGYN